jgi:hypothetical protein
MAVAIVVLKRMLPQSENGVFNAANIFTPSRVSASAVSV